jgi:hypothetical protein
MVSQHPPAHHKDIPSRIIATALSEFHSRPLAEFAPRHALAAVRAGEPLAEVSHHRIPSNRWRRYDKLVRTPGGYWFSATPSAAST